MIAVCLVAVLCLAGAGLADNPELCQQGMCTMDYIPHCMTDGTIVFGCVGLKNAVCKDKKTEQTGWTPSQACRPSDYCENLACTYDLIPHCLSDGSIARGCHALRHAICTKNLTEKMSWSPLTSCLPDGYCESDVCTADLIPHCMNNGDIVHGCSPSQEGGLPGRDGGEQAVGVNPAVPAAVLLPVQGVHQGHDRTLHD
ncbi:uncharacterized protein LOC124137428 [Haliotis rufescens]|uniref:uncharacterized protein LOC124137428 n=1 Tax=Haliotis rufescens TaxID=6454 RepID=UPI00201F38E2|nr:uncharacterized protein LOC124137428 [Haliotis rufescens]